MTYNSSTVNFLFSVDTQLCKDGSDGKRFQKRKDLWEQWRLKNNFVACNAFFVITDQSLLRQRIAPDAPNFHDSSVVWYCQRGAILERSGFSPFSATCTITSVLCSPTRKKSAITNTKVTENSYCGEVWPWKLNWMLYLTPTFEKWRVIVENHPFWFIYNPILHFLPQIIQILSKITFWVRFQNLSSSRNWLCYF